MQKDRVRSALRACARPIAAIVVAAGCASIRADAPAVPLAVPGRGSANVSLAAADRFVAAVWSASTESGAADVYASVSRDAGATFSPPVRVNSTPDAARVNGEQPPRVALVRKPDGPPSLVVVWTGKGEAGTRLLTARSDDGGKTFGAMAVLAGTDAPGNRGWETVASDANGRVDVIWLDHRDTVQGGSADMSHHLDHNLSAPMQMDSVARAQLSKLYFSAVGGASQAHIVTSGVCYCCKTALAIGAGGSVFAAWRHVYPGNMRDIAFTMSHDGGRTFAAPIRVSEDKWALDGCPENGPAMAVDSKQVVHLTWPTLLAGANGSGALALFYAASRDGRRFTPREEVPTVGTPRHVQIVAAGIGSIVLAWDETDDRGRRIAVARGVARADGRVEFHRQAIGTLGDASYPAIAWTADGALVAAASGGDRSTIRVARLGF